MCRSAARKQGRAATPADLYGAVMEGAVERVRPKMMTVVAIMAGLLPIMWGSGTGSEVMSRIAAPMVGGMISSTVLTLVVIPALYAMVKEWELRRAARVTPVELPFSVRGWPRSVRHPCLLATTSRQTRVRVGYAARRGVRLRRLNLRCAVLCSHRATHFAPEAASLEQVR